MSHTRNFDKLLKETTISPFRLYSALYLALQKAVELSTSLL